MNAAGPWREDLENAPRYKMLRLMCRGERGNLYELWSRFEYAEEKQHIIIAWGEFNEPETTNVND